MLLALCRRLLAPSSKLPLIMCSSRPIKEHIATSAKDEQRSVGDLISDFEGLSSKLKSAGKDNARKHHQQKDMKRRGFQTVVQWCGAHQEGLYADVKNNREETLENMDAAAIEWINSSMHLLSCGQCLVLLSFVSDVVLRKFSAKASAGDDSGLSGAMEDTIYSLCNTIASLIQRATSSDQLERQSLPILMGALYALHRLTSPTSPAKLDEVMLLTLEPPHALWFAMIHKIRALPTNVSESDLESPLAAELLLTFLLLMVPDRKANLLSNQDMSIFRVVFQRLQAILEPRVLKQKDIESSSSPHGDDEGANGNPSTMNTLADKAVDATACITMQECVSIQQNIAFAKSHDRLRVLNFTMCVLRKPEHMSEADIALLPHVFHSLRDIDPRQRNWLTDYIIQCLPTFATSSSSSSPLRLSFLPYMKNPLTHIATLGIDEETAGTLPLDDVVNILRFGADQLSWEQYKCLLTSILNRCTTNPGPGAVGEQLEEGQEEALGTISLTPTVVTALQYLFLKLLPATAAAVPGDDGSINSNREEIMALSRSIAARIEWATGLEADPLFSANHSKVRSVQASSLPALRIYLECRSQFPEVTAVVDDKQLLNGYVRPILHNDAIPPRAALPALLRVIQMLQTDKFKAELLKRVIRFNGTADFNALYRFLDTLAPWASQLGVSNNAELNGMLLKRHNLDPRNFHQLRRRLEHLSPEAHLRMYTTILQNALQYILVWSEWKQVSGGEKITEMRTVVSSWIDHYLFTLSKGRTAVHSSSSGAVVDNVHPADDNADSSGGVTANEGADADEDDDCPEAEEEGEDAPSAAAEVASVTDSDIEDILSSALVIGCKLKGASVEYIIHQHKAKVAPFIRVNKTTDRLHEDDEGGEDDDDDAVQTNGHVYVDSTTTSALPAELLPLPAHFVFLQRGDRAAVEGIPFNEAYLHRLLGECHRRIYVNVLSTFLFAVRNRRAKPNLITDMRIMAVAFETIMMRIENGEECTLTPVSFLIRRLLTAYLNHIDNTHDYQKELAARSAQLPRSKKSSDNTDREDAFDETLGEGEPLMDDGATAAAAGDISNTTELDAMHDETEKLLLRAIALLSREDVKEAALGPHTSKMHMYFPEAASYLHLRVLHQADSLSQKELLLLATRCPESERDIVEQLGKSDIRLTVDFGDYLKQAKFLPMGVNSLIIEAHVNTLTFAWCTRLLSTLAAVHDTLPFAVLKVLIHRVQELVPGTSESDRNLLLLVLQGYLSFEPLPTTQRGVEPTIATTRPVPLSADEMAERQELIRSCCDKLLLLDNVKDLTALQHFLTAYPPTLQSMVETPIIQQAEKVVLPALLSSADIVLVVQFAQLLHKHHMLCYSTTHMIWARVFSEDWNCASGASSSPSSQLSVTYVELSLLLACGRGKGAMEEVAIATEAGNALAWVLKRFSSASEQLATLTALADFNNSHYARGAAQPLINSSVGDICCALVRRGDELSSSEFAKLMQNISRLKRWSILKPQQEEEGAETAIVTLFDQTFHKAYRKADAHSRCVIVKAMSTDKDVFTQYESFAMNLLRDDIGNISHEDLEFLLVAMLNMTSLESVETLLDAVGTRLLGMMDQCRRSTLVRLLQCHAAFDIRDAELLTTALSTLEEQCGREVRLDAMQIITVLQSIVSLALPIPERFVVSCFIRLEKVMESLTPQQLAHVCQLAMDVEMGYTSSVHALVTRLLESRDGIRSGKTYREVVERICETYEIEIPATTRAVRLRGKHKRERLQLYWERRAQLSAQ